MKTKLALGAVLLAVLAAAGCDSSMAQDRITIADPPFDAMVEDAWQSSGWFSTMAAPQPWLEFPAMTTLRVHHTLGRTPASVELYIAPNNPDTNPNGEFGAQAAPPAGDLTVIEDVNDMYVEIRNTVDTPHFLRIVLR
jgi:hypothetical protein